MRYFFWIALIPFALCAGPKTPPPKSTNPPPTEQQASPQQIEKELLSAEEKYAKAKEMFNPWYTGPLITPSAATVPLGSAFTQPYLFLTGAYGSFNSNRDSIPLAHNVYTLKATPILQFGISPTMDLMVIPNGQVSWANHKHGGGFDDFTAIAGWKICDQTLYIPVMKFTVGQTFPTGKYKNLSTNGLRLNSTGGGTYQTQFGLALSKIIWWTYPYPLRPRFFVGYTLQTPVHVTGFNTYGGGFGTNGKVKPGNTLSTDLGLELSLTQRWVLALDVIYTAQNRTKFHGNPGTTATGAPASVGGGYNDNLSLAPAIEYNWNANLGIITGAQFSVYGRNSSNFVNGQFSVIYAW